MINILKVFTITTRATVNSFSETTQNFHLKYYLQFFY